MKTMKEEIELIKTLREKKNISQMRLAQLTGIYRDKITRFECGYASPTKQEIKTMKEAIHEYRD